MKLYFACINAACCRFVWGFKHPRALTLLPYYKGALDKKMKVIHVIRDGRDIALGDNRMMMRSLCKRYFGEDLAAKGYCRSGTENRNDVSDLGSLTNLRAHSARCAYS